MYGLNKNIDLTFLKGRELIQIVIGIYQIIFHFDEEVKISAEAKFEHVSKEESCVWRPEAPALATSAVKLLGSTVQSVDWQEDGTLKLAFSNGDQLIVYDSSSEYESYAITCPGRTIVV
jgi:hypothetical protein